MMPGSKVTVVSTATRGPSAKASTMSANTTSRIATFLFPTIRILVVVASRPDDSSEPGRVEHHGGAVRGARPRKARAGGAGSASRHGDSGANARARTRLYRDFTYP